jgi:hypothetical protein
MKNIKIHFLTFHFFLLTTITIYAQPAIEWQNSIGGSGTDQAYSIQQTTDGGFIVAGNCASNDGDALGSILHFNGDFWIVKLSDTGTIQWQKMFGGNEYDNANFVQQTTDSGYIIAGSSASNDGDITGHHGSAGDSDYWIVKLNSIGNLHWQKSLGGTGIDEASSIHQTLDGGYIVGGSSNSNNGDVSGNHGSKDFWVIKISDSGNIQWQKSFGGTETDALWSVCQTTDKGYIIAGLSCSNNGDVTGHHGSIYSADYWVIKTDSIGTIQWQKSLGGTYDDWAYSIQQTTDGGYIVAGGSGSPDGDVTGNHGAFDFWIVKLSNTGSIQWQKSFGGSSPERVYSIQQTSDGGYVACGMTQSNNGDVTGFQGSVDYWMIKIDTVGNLQWQKTLGGTIEDWAHSLCQTADGKYAIAGYSLSYNGDVTGPHGLYDMWVVKLGAVITGVDDSEQSGINYSVYPNPTTDLLNIKIQPSLVGSTYSLTDLMGKTIITGKVMEENSVIDISGFAGGMYFLRVGDDARHLMKLIKH